MMRCVFQDQITMKGGDIIIPLPPRPSVPLQAQVLWCSGTLHVQARLYSTCIRAQDSYSQSSKTGSNSLPGPLPPLAVAPPPSDLYSSRLAAWPVLSYQPRRRWASSMSGSMTTWLLDSTDSDRPFQSESLQPLTATTGWFSPLKVTACNVFFWKKGSPKWETLGPTQSQALCKFCPIFCKVLTSEPQRVIRISSCPSSTSWTSRFCISLLDCLPTIVDSSPVDFTTPTTSVHNAIKRNKHVSNAFALSKLEKKWLTQYCHYFLPPPTNSAVCFLLVQLVYRHKVEFDSGCVHLFFTQPDLCVVGKCHLIVIVDGGVAFVCSLQLRLAKIINLWRETVDLLHGSSSSSSSNSSSQLV